MFCNERSLSQIWKMIDLEICVPEPSPSEEKAGLINNKKCGMIQNCIIQNHLMFTQGIKGSFWLLQLRID